MQPDSPSSSRPTSADVDAWARQMLRSTADFAMFFVSLDGVICSWLGAAERLFGYTADEAVGLPFVRLFTPEDSTRGLDVQERELAVNGGRSEDERWHLRKDGSVFWASGVLQAIRSDDGQILTLCKVLRDKTDIKTQIDGLQNQVRSLTEEKTLRLTTLASVAHELRNLLAAVTSSIAVLRRFLGAEPKVDRAFVVLDRQMPTLSALLGDLNAATSDVLRTPQLQTTRIEVQQAVRDVVSALESRVIERGQLLEVTLPGAPIWIDADKARLAQMVSNLVGNAIKYTPAGGRIDVSATVEGSMAAIRVEDNGNGISEEVLPHIFELFTRGEQRTEIEGLGVGLAVVKKYASLHGGGVEARSPGTGKGSIFTLRLPVVPLSDDTAV